MANRGKTTRKSGGKLYQGVDVTKSLSSAIKEVKYYRANGYSARYIKRSDGTFDIYRRKS